MSGRLMRILSLCILVAVTIFSRAEDIAVSQAIMEKLTSGPVVLFGGSSTAPREEVIIYGDLLQDALRRINPKISIINAGVSGNTTLLARQRFQSDVLNHNPSLVIILFGINDSAIDVWKNPPEIESRVAMVDFRANLEYFVDELLNQDAKVFLVTPNRLRWAPKLREMYGKPPYSPDDEDGFNLVLNDHAEIVRKIAI